MQSLRVGVTAGRFSPKIRPNRFLGFSRGFHFLVFSSFAGAMYISEANGSASHPREDRYDVHEGDVIFNRCKGFG